MSETRRYVSPKRQAQAAATREAILEAFVEQLSEPGRDTLSPSQAALRAGVSVRTVHVHFPNAESQILALGEWFDQHLYPNGVVMASGPDDLPRYFRDIHANALTSPLSRAVATSGGAVWKQVRQQRRAARLDAVRRAVAAIGAPPRATEDATAMLLSLSGADASWPMHDLYGLPLERIPDVLANTVSLIVEQLKSQAAVRRTTSSTRRARAQEMPRLTADELDHLLATNGLVRIATIADDGGPLVVPVAYVYRDRQVLLTARARVGWLANIRRDPRVCLSIDANRYPLAKVTIRGRAEIVFEPGQDDRWRDVRLPLPDPSEPGPTLLSDGREEWRYDEAYRVMTHDEPRALVAVALDGSEVTSWRMPVEGEYVEESWAARYYEDAPRRFRVTEVGPRMRDVKVIAE